MDTIEPYNIYLVSKDAYTTTTKLGFEDAEQRIPEELGLRLSSLFMYDRILFVEGPSDEAVVREWAPVVGTNLSLLNVGFIHLRGIGNFAHYAAQEILNFLTRRRVKLWFLLDRDERSEEEIRVIRDRVGDAAKILVLGRRELENYLVQPRVNIEYLSQRRRADGKTEAPPSIGDVTQQFAECADRLKQYTIWKRVADTVCRPIYAEREQPTSAMTANPGDRAREELNAMKESVQERLNHLEATIKSVTNNIEKRWEADKLNIVPGAVLLDEWYKVYGYRFLKLRDSPVLASLMRANEIAPEIVELIKEVGST